MKGSFTWFMLMLTFKDGKVRKNFKSLSENEEMQFTSSLRLSKANVYHQQQILGWFAAGNYK